MENDSVLRDGHFGGESLGCELCSGQIVTAISAVIFPVIHCDEKASMFMTAIWAVSKLSLLSSKELHDGHLGGDSLAFPFIPVHFLL